MSNSELEVREISTPRVGRFKVYVQGNLKQTQCVVLTVHDLGCNHNMWMPFVCSPAMEEMKKRCVFVHVDVPGQEDGAAELPSDYSFPSMQHLGEDLVCVLDQLDVPQVICLGEGAGANIIARFAIAHPNRVLGLCLIHCTGSTAGMMESVKDKLIKWKLDHIGMNPTAEAYLVLHRFGSFEKAQNKDQLNKVIQSFQESLRSNINPRNLKRFVDAFLKRSNLNDHCGKVKCGVLMVTGSKASFNHTVHKMYTAFQSKEKKRSELLEVDGVSNVLEEKPDRLAESFQYFVQGIGYAGGVPMPRVRRTSAGEGFKPPIGRNRSLSMEEADQPKGIYSCSPPK